ncbi:MAG: DUF1667 domain-containing protein [Caldisericota bacterium]|nr:DUF1667 domain-containing protein [Caldisericota bacterium]
MIKHFTCVICPMGCEIDAEEEKGKIISLKGNKCARGKEFVVQELEEPLRVLTTTVRIEGAEFNMLPVRTDKPIPKRLIPVIMEDIAKIEINAPVKMYKVIVKNIAGTKVNIIATRSM